MRPSVQGLAQIRMERGLKRFLLVGLSSLAPVWVAVGCGTIDPSKPSGESGEAGQAAVPGSPGDGGSAGNSGGDAGGSPTDGGAAPAAGGGGGAPPALEPLLPWNVGNRWTYRITKNGVVTKKTTVVGEVELVGGTGPNADLMAHHVSTDKGVKDHTESWQARSLSEPDRVVRFREQAFSAATGKLQSEVFYDPEKLHVDSTPEHTVAGATWLEEYAETTLAVGLSPVSHDVSERWRVIADGETLEVPAGTFDGVIHLRKVGNSTKDYWYLRGVGKLKETGTQTEELTDYTLVP